MAEIFYKNLRNGEYDRKKKISDWFSSFLESFKDSSYVGQYGRLKPWQYKNYMKLVESNHWNRITDKQLDVFLRNLTFENGTYEKFSCFVHNGKTWEILISNHTGSVDISIK